MRWFQTISPLLTIVTILISPSYASTFTIPRGGGFAPLSSSSSTTTAMKQQPQSSPTATATTTTLSMTAASAVMDVPSGGGGGTATVSNEIFNLVKNIVGAGVLGLSAGVAAFGSAPTAILPATILITLIGTLSGYCFSLIGRVCATTGALTYRDAWDKSIGSSTSWIPAASCTAKTCLAVLAYSMILGDTVSALLKTGGLTVGRTSSLLGVTGTVLLPLCLLKNLSSLAPFSLLGIIGMGYTTAAMAIRYLSGAYKLPDGKFLKDLPAASQPAFGTAGATSVFSSKSFILICMLSTAYMAHFNAPKFYTELKDNTIERYNRVVFTSFGISIAIFAGIAALGFLTFGTASAGLILNNYSTTDSLMSLSRIAVAISIIFSYPLAFTGARDGILDLFNVKPTDRTNGLLNQLTVGILSVITALALKVKDLAFLMSIGGATLGNALIYVYPALMFRGAVKKMGEGVATKGQKREVVLAMGTAALGVLMGGIGGRMAIKSLGA